jgi:O-antigen ligase
VSTNLAVRRAVNHYRLRFFYAVQRWGRLTDVAIMVVGIVLVVACGFLIGQGEKGLYVLAGVIGLIAGVVIAIKPRVGIYLLVVFVYLNFSDILEVYFGIVSINKVLVTLVVAAVLANRIVLYHKPLFFDKTLVAILIYGIVLLVSAFLAGDQSVSFRYLIDWIKDIALLVMIVQLCDEEHNWENIQWLLILSAGLLGTLSCYQMLSGNVQTNFFGLANTTVNQITNTFDSARVGGPLSDPNYYAQIILMIMPIAAYRVLTETHPFKRGVAAYCTLVILATVFFTYSRSAFIAMLVLLFLILLERKFNLSKVGFFALAFALIAMPILPAGYLDRIMTLESLFGGGTGTQTDLSFRGRSSEMLVAVNMFLDHPVFGLGVANFEENYLLYSEPLGIDPRLENREAHSLYLEILAETGIVGEAAFATVLATVFLTLRQAKKLLFSVHRDDLAAWVTGVQFGVLSFLLTSIFLHGAYSRYMWLIISVAAGANIMAKKVVDQHRRQPTSIEQGGITALNGLEN